MAASENFRATAPTSTTLHPTTGSTTENGSYDSDYDDELCDKTDIIQFGETFIPVLYSLVLIFSVFGNAMVIVIVSKYENLKSPINAFILNLALSDLVFTVGLPFWIYYHMYTRWTLGEPACKMVSFIFNVGFYSSGILLNLMTVQRYKAVMSPTSESMLTRGRYSVLLCLAIWAFSVFISIPDLLFTEVSEEEHCFFGNSFWGEWGIYQQNIFFVVSVLILLFCYTQITCRLLTPVARRRNCKTLKLIFILMFVFFVGWGPYNIIIFLNYRKQSHDDSEDPMTKCESSKKLDYALYISRIFAFSHCGLNPVFYVFVGVKFKNHIKRLFTSCGKNNGVHSRRSRHRLTSLTSGEECSV